MEIITKKRPVASVIIDNYNYGHFIEEAIESVLNQTVSQSEIEIIVVDDGSTDDTKERIIKYKDKIKYIYKENGGQGSAFNIGFKASKGEIIFLLDADDVFYPDKIRQICEIYNNHKCQAVFNSLLTFGEGIVSIQNLASYYLQFLSRIDQKIYKRNYKDNMSSFVFLAQTSGQSYKRELLEKIFPIPLSYKYAADMYLHALTLLYEDIYFVYEPLTKYRQHIQSFESIKLSGNLEYRITELNFVKDTINILEKYNNERSKILVKSIQNSLYFLNFKLEKFKGNKLKALNHLLKYKTSPKSIKARTSTKVQYLLDLILPDHIYKI